MIKVAVVEDSKEYRNILLSYLERYEKDNGIELRTVTFSDGALLLEDYKCDYDIILMDIDMPLTDGMSAAEEIRQKDNEVIIIFVTNMTQYALRGYTVGALDYVLKPVNYVAFSEKLNKAVLRTKSKEERFVLITSERTTQKLSIKDIYYIESRNHTLIFHTVSGDIETRGKMKIVEEKLIFEHFFRLNYCYLVNLRHVETVRKDCAIVNGEELAISRSRKKDFMKVLVNYVGGIIN